MFGSTPREKAYFAPFFVFLGLLGLREVVGKIFEGQAAPWLFHMPVYWVFPLQTVVCGTLLFHWRRHYDLRAPRQPGFAIFVGLLVFVLWITPQQFLHFPPRTDGFDPGYFGGGWPYFANVAFRFLRLVIVVPLVEEIFWRGYLLRFLVDDDFSAVPFGAFSWLSFAVVTAGFTFEHAQADWPAAAITGVLYNIVAYRTRSLSACVVAHALTNFALGIYVMRTGQFGFW